MILGSLLKNTGCLVFATLVFVWPDMFGNCHDGRATWRHEYMTKRRFAALCTEVIASSPRRIPEFAAREALIKIVGPDMESPYIQPIMTYHVGVLTYFCCYIHFLHIRFEFHCFPHSLRSRQATQLDCLISRVFSLINFFVPSIAVISVIVDEVATPHNILIRMASLVTQHCVRRNEAEQGTKWRSWRQARAQPSNWGLFWEHLRTPKFY